MCVRYIYVIYLWFAYPFLAGGVKYAEHNYLM
jgi:hypothetical protein